MRPPAGAQAVLRALEQHQQGLAEPYKVTAVGMWACSEPAELLELFQAIDLGAYGHLVDLGSGDGRAVLLASLFTRATGIEADPKLLAAGRELAHQLELERAAFIQGDCRQQDLSPYDLLFIYPDKPLTWLEKMLPTPWAGRLLVYGSGFRPQALTPDGELRVGRTPCSLWRR